MIMEADTNTKAKIQEHIKEHNGTIPIERFSTWRRIDHIFVILVFVMLVLTGFPQKFFDAAWAARAVDFFGGVDKTRLIHRIFGVTFAIHALIHIGIIIAGVFTSKMRLSLLPTSEDFRDLFASLKYYLGYQHDKPTYPKFDYRQKFEYIGIVLGSLVMVVSGLILLFPGWFAGFLPGQVIPASQVMHSNEALLAFLVLTIWHVYGSHFSPEVFPMDKTIFTGYIDEHELKERHYREYARIFPEKAQQKSQSAPSLDKKH